jgi:histidinol-phosphate/aromatic aminotransferase/cobyric acid decarboxylase-like protein
LLAERTRLVAALGQCPRITRVWPSEANFLLVDCLEPDDVLARARAAGLLIRDVRQPALPVAVRISVGTPKENQRLLESLR